MSWLSVALGLVREVVGSEQGRETIRNVRDAMKREPGRKDGEAPPDPAGTMDVAAAMEAMEGMLASHRAETERNLTAIVDVLNSQNQRLTDAIEKQRRWNIGMLIAWIALAATGAIVYFIG